MAPDIVATLRWQIAVSATRYGVKQQTISSIGQLPVVASSKVVAVLHEKPIVMHTRIDAATCSAGGKPLVISDCDELLLCGGTTARVSASTLRCVVSLTFSRDGKVLARTPERKCRFATWRRRRSLVACQRHKTFDEGPTMADTQGRRMRIACKHITLMKEVAVAHRILLWDTASGAVAPQIVRAVELS